MHIINDPMTKVFHGDSPQDVAAWLDATPALWTYDHSRSNMSSRAWDLDVGYRGAWKLADSGWSDGARDLSYKLDALPAPTTRHVDERYDVGGHFPDVPRYLSGRPDHMVTRGRRQGNPPVVHLVINGVCSATITATEYANFGLAMAAMCDRLEASGRRVELDVTFCHNFGARKAIQGWKVKLASEHPDMSNIAFSLGHPAAFRRIGFAMVERSPYTWQNPGYGTCGTLSEADLPLLNAEGAFLINGIGESRGACSTVKGATVFAAKAINAAAKETLVTVDEA